MKSKSKENLQYVVDDRGHRLSVVLPLDRYESMLEDIADLAAVAERREEERVEHSAVVARLKADGLL